MSFIDSATEVIDRAEASLNSLLMDALKAKAYREVAAIAALADAVAAIPGRSGQGKKLGGSEPGIGIPAGVSAEGGKTSEPSWMRPKA